MRSVTRLDPSRCAVSSEPLLAAQRASPVPLTTRPRRGLAYLVVFASAAIGAGLVRTVATTYLPVLLAEIRDAPALIGAVMLVNSVAGFAVPLLVGRWSDRRHTLTHGRRPFIAGGSVLAACGMGAVALGHGTSILVLTLAGAVAYVGVNVVSTTHRALIHDCFDGEGVRAGRTAPQEIAMLVGGLVGLADRRPARGPRLVGALPARSGRNAPARVAHPSLATGRQIQARRNAETSARCATTRAP